ncbi:putative enzyme related to lactoylglutathione lyase [Streptomyces sp. V4I2]|nr:putative enzyme related to lactoylglutathione lyase [Streptomyces sp. V4I2]
MEFTLEVIPLPVTDIDRARDFYRDRVGFHVDIDQEVMPGMRIVQLTPPGSGCSIALGDSIWEMAQGPRPAPGSYQGLQLCVTDIKAAHAPSWSNAAWRSPSRSSTPPTTARPSCTSRTRTATAGRSRSTGGG